MGSVFFLFTLLFGASWSCKTVEPSQVARNPQGESKTTFPPDFWFGVATAPAHAEDQLNDTWLQLAQDRSKAAIKSWKNAGYPELRLKFWTDYKTEIDLAHDLGVNVFRMGVDWTRLAPAMPRTECPELTANCLKGVTEQNSLARYRDIIRYAKSKGMAVMVTLFHHSIPPWLMTHTKSSLGKNTDGGWTNPDTVEYFTAFARDVVTALKDDVDMWVIFNEPNVFASLSYGVGIWPPAKQMDMMAMLKLGYYKGAVYQAFDQMIAAHKKVYPPLVAKNSAFRSERQ